MEKKSRVLVLIFLVAILVSIFLVYKRSFVDKDFIIEETTEEIAEEME